MEYTHLSVYEGGRIDELIYDVFSKREVARKLDRSPSTISRKLKRNFEDKAYDGKRAQARYEDHRTRSV